MLFFRICFLFLTLCTASAAFAAAGDTAASNSYSFVDDPEGAEEEKEIVSHFECYDMTDDADRSVCLDATLYLLDEILQGAYRERVSLVAGNKTYFFKREFDQWRANRERKCGGDVDCYINLYKRKIVETQNSPKVAQLRFSPGEGYGTVPVSLFGRYNGTNYYIDRIGVGASRNAKTKAEEFYMYEFLDKKNWQLVMTKPQLNQLDANFDGADDLVFFLGSQGKEGKKVAYLLFDPETSSFKLDVRLNSLNISYFNERHGFIHVEWEQEGGNYGTDFYNYNSKGVLQRAFRNSFIDFVDQNGLEKVKRTVYKRRGKRQVKVATDDIEKSQVGEIPEIMLREEAVVEKVTK